MTTPRHLVIASAFAVLTTAGAGAPDLADLERRIERGSLRCDAAIVNTAIDELDRALRVEPASPALLYLRGYAEYAAANVDRAINDPGGAIAHLQRAVGLLEQVRGDTAWTPEAAALASSLCGQLMPLLGEDALATYGVKAGKLLATAMSGAPASPRVLFLRGAARLNTPVEYGGDRAEGAALLQQAVDAFATQDANAAGPHWGHADALSWLGIARRELGDPEAARAAWSAALALEPEFAWVKYGLLPSVNPVPSSTP